MSEPAEMNELGQLLEHLKATRGFDFTGYKLSTLVRRVRKRMKEVGVETYPDYVDYLEVHQDEFLPLFNTVLINVTSFFRDAPAWEHLRAEVIPRLVRDKPPGSAIRVWSAGCASGEEAYSLAMLLAEELGVEQFVERVKIYGTDVDEEALAAARQATYERRQVVGVPPELLARYFDSLPGDRHVFRRDLRRMLIFGRHDLVQDAAISRVDLLACRNTLMYFNSEIQARILARFRFALREHGFLFLGRAETLLAHGNNGFRPDELQHRLFVKTPAVGLRDRLPATAPGAAAEPQPPERHPRVHEAAFESGPVAQLVIGREGRLQLANERARRLLRLRPADLGRPLQDLEVSYRPVELRSHLEEAIRTRALVRVEDVEWRDPDGQLRRLEVQIVHLVTEGEAIGQSVSFLDLTQSHELRAELQRAHQELETAHEELQSANEELETANEELQSTIEELETTNEELQSANEELETMNEELQSTNEELRTMNEQVHERSEAVEEGNRFLHSILASLEAGVVVLDQSLNVRVWSPHVEDLWGLRSAEVVARPFLKLDIGLPVEALKRPLSDCLAGVSNFEQVVLDGVNRRGKPIRCRVSCAALGDHDHQPDGRPRGVVLTMEEERP